MKNSADLIRRLNNADFNAKKMASFDVKAPETNVPIDGAMGAADNINEDQLPVSKAYYRKLVSLCVSLDPFRFSEEDS